MKPEYEIYSLDTDGNGCLDDGERDEDGDFLTNVQETANQLSGPQYWIDVYGDTPFRNKGGCLMALLAAAVSAVSLAFLVEHAIGHLLRGP